MALALPMAVGPQLPQPVVIDAEVVGDLVEQGVLDG